MSGAHLAGFVVHDEYPTRYKFVKAERFPFLLAALIVLVFGPGLFSIDALIERILRRKEKAKLGV